MLAPTGIAVPRIDGSGVVLRPFADRDVAAVLDASMDPAITDVTW